MSKKVTLPVSPGEEGAVVKDGDCGLMIVCEGVESPLMEEVPGGERSGKGQKVQSLSYKGLYIKMCSSNSVLNSLHTEIVCTSAIITAKINIICLRVKVSSIA